MDIFTCDREGCERKTYRRGMCRPHHELDRGYDRNPKRPAECDDCGSEYMKTHGATTKRCPPCARRVGSETQRINWPQCRVHFVQCPTCHSLFSTRHLRKYCAPTCRPMSHHPVPSQVRPCAECAQAKQNPMARYCTDCRRSRLKETRRSQKAARRAMKRGVLTVLVAPTLIYERDAWICGICSRSVDSKRAYPDPKSVSLDHIVPLANGGTHEPMNLQCSHLDCNMKKSNRIKSVQLRLA